MDKEQELTKLVNVLRQTARVAMQPDWMDSNEDAADFCISQYNRIYERMKELDPSVATVFAPLPEGSSLKIAAIACRQLAAYYRDEVDQPSDWQGACGAAFDPQAFKNFWRKGGFDIQELGEAIRESVQIWAQQRGKHSDRGKHGRHSHSDHGERKVNQD